MACSGTLTAAQEKALAALLSERTVEAAATSAKVGLRTLWRWMKTPAFAAAYREARAMVVSHAISRLQQASADAVDTLTAVMNDQTIPAPARVQAAKTVLEMAVKGTELAELHRRLDDLEQARDTPPEEPAKEAEIVT